MKLNLDLTASEVSMLQISVEERIEKMEKRLEFCEEKNINGDYWKDEIGEFLIIVNKINESYLKARNTK